MSNIGITIDVPQGQMNELSRIIQLRAGYLRESMIESTLWASWFIARAAGVATAVAPRKRRVKLNPYRGQLSQNGRRLWAKWVAVRQFSKKARAASGENYVQLIPLTSEIKENAEQENAAKIRDYEKGRQHGRGLAKYAWMWMVGQARRKNASNGRWPIGRGSEQRYIQYEYQATGEDISVTLHNRLSYAAAAMKSTSVDSIISRGTTSMRKDLERRAKIKIAGAV